ncbi:hypothetical protein D3C86_2034550 [compost metagenome]
MWLHKYFHSHGFQPPSRGFVSVRQIVLQLFDVFAMPSLQQHIEYQFFGYFRSSQAADQF